SRAAGVSFAPELRSGRDIDQLGLNVEFTAMFQHAPGQHCIDMQIVPDPLRIVQPRFVMRHSASSHHVEIWKPGKRIGDLLGDTFTEVIHFGVFARIRKRQYGYRMDRYRIGSAGVKGAPNWKSSADKQDRCRSYAPDQWSKPGRCSRLARSDGTLRALAVPL